MNQYTVLQGFAMREVDLDATSSEGSITNQSLAAWEFSGFGSH